MAAKFGNYAIVDPITHYFDQEPDLFWKIKPVSSGLELERSKFMLHNRVIEGPDGIRREMPPSWMEVAYREIALTFGGTNIPNEEGEPVLSDNATVAQVETLLREMPQAMVMEIWKKIGASYPKWGPIDPNAI
jgi:hypothetical protein